MSRFFLSGNLFFCPAKFFRLSDSCPATLPGVSRRLVQGSGCTWLIFCNFFYKGDNFCDFLFDFLHIEPFRKEVNSKRKEFAPMGSKFFPFRVDPILEEGQNQFVKVSSHESQTNSFSDRSDFSNYSSFYKERTEIVYRYNSCFSELPWRDDPEIIKANTFQWVCTTT